MSNFTHIAGTFLIQANNSFLNGAGLDQGEDRNTTVPKTLKDGNHTVPYVSAQAWKRWLRNTLIEETRWAQSELRAIDKNEKGNTKKIAGELNPVEYAEDDIFGYMEAKSGQGKDAGEDDIEENEAEKKKGKSKTKALIRTSPFMASILVSLRKKGWRGVDEGFVHLKEGTPQPYRTKFYTTDLQAIFCLDYSRLGVFKNIGDRIELDELKSERFIKDGLITEVKNGNSRVSGEIYQLTNLENIRKQRAGELLNALSVLRGGAKQAAFGTDVSPKCIILAGLSCGNPIFNNLFEEEDKLIFKTEAFKQILGDYRDRITTKVYVGIRNQYIDNEEEIAALGNEPEFKDMLVIKSPIETVKDFVRTELGYSPIRG